MRHSSTWQTIDQYIQSRRGELLRKLLNAQTGDIRKEDQLRGRIKELDELVRWVKEDNK